LKTPHVDQSAVQLRAGKSKSKQKQLHKHQCTQEGAEIQIDKSASAQINTGPNHVLMMSQTLKESK